MMAKYRLRTSDVDAFQWLGQPVPGHRISDWFHVGLQKNIPGLTISTLGGWTVAYIGDYVETDSYGNEHVVSAEMFNALYKALPEN